MWANVAILVGLTLAVVAPGVFLLRRLRAKHAGAARVLETVLIAVLSLGAGAAAAELVARRYVDVPASLQRQGYAEYRPGRLGLRAHADWTWDTQNPQWKRFRVRTNADGLRTPVAPGARPWPNERRMIFYGDSFTFGLGLDPDETYPAQAAELLRRDARTRWVAVNAGVPGYNFFSAVDLFEWTADHYSPSVVVFTVHEEDDLRPDLNDDPRKRATGVLAGLRRFALYRFLRAGTVHVRERYDEAVRGDGRAGSTGMRWRERNDRMRAHVARVRAVADRVGCEVVIHVLTHHDEFEPTPFQAFTQVDAQVVVTRWAPHDPTRTIPRDGHPNAAGARFLAERVVPAIRVVSP